jgi:hypothetical protein
MMMTTTLLPLTLETNCKRLSFRECFLDRKAAFVSSSCYGYVRSEFISRNKYSVKLGSEMGERRGVLGVQQWVKHLGSFVNSILWFPGYKTVV